MATIALAPLIVAKINALLASSACNEAEPGFSSEDIIELFEAFMSERVHLVELSQPGTSRQKSQKPYR
jgi:hypothetical protein